MTAATPSLHRPGVLARTGPALLLVPTLGFLCVFLAVPFTMVVMNSLTDADGAFTLRNYFEIVTDEFYWEIMGRTLRISLFTTLFALLLGYPASLYLYFSESRWRRVFLFVVVSPLFISVIVRTYGWVMIFTPSGALNALLPEALEMRLLKTEAAIVIGMMHIYIPFMILSLNANMARLDKRLLTAATTLGASTRRTFLDVLLPLSLPGIVSGCVIVFSVSMTAFSTPVLLGGTSNKTMAFMIYQENLMLFDPHDGGVLAIVLLAVCFTFLWIFGRIARRTNRRMGL